MAESRISAIIIGVGEMGRVGVAAMLEHGVNLMGAVDINPELIGKDVAEVAGLKPIGVKIEGDLETLLSKVRPQIAFASFASELDVVAPVFMTCAKHKINVSTISMDTLCPYAIDAKLAKELDDCFKENGVTLFASGIQDVFWSGVGMALAGACKKIESLELINVLPLNGMGYVVVEEFMVGKTADEFRRACEGMDHEKNPSVSGPLLALYDNCAIMGLNKKSIEVNIEPILADKDIPVPEWDMVIKKDTMTGQSFNADVFTEEGVTFYSKMIIKLLDDSEKPGTEWFIKGEPNLRVSLGDIHGEITTSATAVNRFRDVIKAGPGIKTIADLFSGPVYRSGDWHV
jgi:4-hydroxy-tetrahydrodipicolinate reductase